MIRLTIGLLENQPGWIRLLDQSGLSYEILDGNKDVSPDRFSAVIVNGPLDSKTFDNLMAYQNAGGAILDNYRFIKMKTNDSFRRRRLKHIFNGTSDSVFPDFNLAEIQGISHIHRHAGWLENTVYFNEASGQLAVQIPFNLNACYMDNQYRRKYFYNPFGVNADEVVSRVSKNEIRKLVFNALGWLHHQRGIPLAHRWYYPDRHKNLFLFRVDTDYGTREQIEALYKLITDYGIAATWFVHTMPHQGWLDYFSAMAHQEIAVHGHRHRTFRSFRRNYANIEKARQLLIQAGARPVGFASPTGRYNRAIRQVIRAMHFLYSSEFTLDYDNLPFMADSGPGNSAALQIPIHPVCIGSLIRNRTPENDMEKYFRYIMDKKISHDEPLTLYHHPPHERLKVVESIFLRVREAGITTMTFSDYAYWWLDRLRTAITAYYDTAAQEIKTIPESDFHPSGVTVRLLYNHKQAFIGNEARYTMRAIEWKERSRIFYTIPFSSLVTPRMDWRLLKRNLIDFKRRMAQ